MKGLLLKEWYTLRKYCRAYLLIVVGFLVVSFFNKNMFFVYYPCLLCGLISVNLLGYDEHSGWNRYSGTLPCGRAQLVSAKYLVGLFALLAILAVTGLVQAVKMQLDGAFRLEALLTTMLFMTDLTMISNTVCLPIVFKLGTKKGGIVYFVMVALFLGGLSLVSTLFSGNWHIGLTQGAFLLCLTLGSAGLYALSWCLSVAFYKKREL